MLEIKNRIGVLTVFVCELILNEMFVLLYQRHVLKQYISAIYNVKLQPTIRVFVCNLISNHFVQKCRLRTLYRA